MTSSGKDPMERILKATAQERMEQDRQRDAAFLQRMQYQIRRGESPKPAGGGVRRRRQWTPVYVAAAAALLLLVTSILLFLPGDHGRSGLIYQEGDVEFHVTDLGARFTSGSGGRFVYALTNGRGEIFVDEGCEILVTPSGELHLERGHIWVHVNRIGEGVVIRTPDGMVTVIGTLFSVEVGEVTSVRVARGGVRITVGEAGLTLGGGESSSFGDGIEGLQKTTSHVEPPDWVWELADMAVPHEWRESFPSGSPH